MEDKLNLELRMEILKFSLTIEEELNKLLKEKFEIIKDAPNTLGNKSSNISFKTKIDFLYDLALLSSEEYNELVFFGEIRNQFIHNLQCNSFLFLFTKTYLKEKKNKILRFYPDYNKNEVLTDEILYLSFKYFTAYILELVFNLSIKTTSQKHLNTLDIIWTENVLSIFSIFIENEKFSFYDEYKITGKKLIALKLELEKSYKIFLKTFFNKPSNPYKDLQELYYDSFKNIVLNGEKEGLPKKDSFKKFVEIIKQKFSEYNEKIYKEKKQENK